MDLIKFIFACSILVPLTSTTYIYRRPIAYPNSEVSRISERRDHSASTVKKENSHENIAEPNVLTPGPPAVPLYPPPLFLVPVREEPGHSSGNGGGFGAFGSLVIPGLHLNLVGGGNGFLGSLSTTGGLSGGYGSGHNGGAQAGGFAGALVTPVQYGYPVQHVAGTGGFATVGAHQGFTPFYAGANGIHHIKGSKVPAGASGVNISPTGPILGGISPQKYDYQGKQPEGLLEVSAYQQEGEDFEQSVLPPGFHHPGFIGSTAGRLGYPVVMASPEQLQDISLRQNQNPFVQFFQRPFQLLQMFVRPNQGNSSKEPEKPETEKPVVESPVAGKPGPEKPVEAKPSSQKPSASQNHASVNKVQESKQNVSASANHHKKPSGSGSGLGSASVSADSKDTERPKPSAQAAGVSDVIASVNEVVKATSAVNAGSAPILPVLIDEARDDANVAAESTAGEVADANANTLSNEESAIVVE